MRQRVEIHRWLGVCAALLLAAAGRGAWAAAEDTAPRAVDPYDRSIERLRYECYSTLGRREITLFANGTVRVREGLKTSPTMSLGELGREQLDDYLARLRDIDLKETDADSTGVGGEWVERCRLQLDRPGDRERVFSFGRYDTRPPGVEALVRVAEDLAARVQPAQRAQHLPTGYVPRAGDVLRRVDGQLFRIIGETADKQGVELDGVEVPLRLYTPKGALQSEFDKLVARRNHGGREEPYDDQ